MQRHASHVTEIFRSLFHSLKGRLSIGPKITFQKCYQKYPTDDNPCWFPSHSQRLQISLGGKPGHNCTCQLLHCSRSARKKPELWLASLGFPQETAALSKVLPYKPKQSTKLQTRKSLIALNFLDQGRFLEWEMAKKKWKMEILHLCFITLYFWRKVFLSIGSLKL